LTLPRKQPFRARLQLLARLTLNTRNDAANQPARLAQLDDGNDRAIWSRATRDLLKSFGWGIAALHRLMQRRSCHFLAARPIASFGIIRRALSGETVTFKSDFSISRTSR
jgi:hypothetical protein